MSEQLDELKVLFPEEISVEVKEYGETVVISPFKFKKIFKVLDVIAKIAEQMAKSGNENEAIIKLLGESEDKVFKILSLALDKPVEWFDNLDGGTGFDIALAVFKVNKSFFENKVKPLLEELALENLPLPILFADYTMLIQEKF